MLPEASVARSRYEFRVRVAVPTLRSHPRASAITGGQMHPWYIATRTFTPRHEGWATYIAWSGLTQLEEVVSLNPSLCPSLLPELKPEDRPHIVNEDVSTDFFVDLAFLMAQIPGQTERNLLCVFRNPPAEPPLFAEPVPFEFLGYDVVDVGMGASALTNCGGFPDVFENSELSARGLLTSHARALEVQAALRTRHPGEPHAKCHVWAVSRAIASQVRPL